VYEDGYGESGRESALPYRGKGRCANADDECGLTNPSVRVLSLSEAHRGKVQKCIVRRLYFSPMARNPGLSHEV
jgi:hypothetical protein